MYEIRRAIEQDVPQILQIYAQARDFMRSTGNPTQWVDGYPGLADVAQDLAHDTLFVCADGTCVQAVFFCAVGPDPTYEHIDGAWLNERPYIVVHRIAARAGSGAGRRCLAWACEQSANVRIDTHEDNAPMRHVLTSLGFVECGIIICDNGTPRVAYQHARS